MEEEEEEEREREKKGVQKEKDHMFFFDYLAVITQLTYRI